MATDKPFQITVDPDAPPRTRRSLAQAALVLNSLLRRGEIVQISDTEFTVAAFIPPPTVDYFTIEGIPVSIEDRLLAVEIA